jgi:hypothetical protein
LIELLVVIAIIGILAAIIIPVVGKVRAIARKAACVSNLHQIGLAHVMYRNDNKGLPPGGGSEGRAIVLAGTGGAVDLKAWGALLPYLGLQSFYDNPEGTMSTPKILLCPHYKGDEMTYWYRTSGTAQLFAGYLLNYYARDKDNSSMKIPTYTDSNTPRSRVIAMDTNFWWLDDSDAGQRPAGNLPHGGGGFNIAAWDASVRWIKKPARFGVNWSWPDMDNR